MAGAHTRCTYARPDSCNPLARSVDDGNVAASSETEADRSMAMFTARRTDAVRIYELHCFIYDDGQTQKLGSKHSDARLPETIHIPRVLSILRRLTTSFPMIKRCASSYGEVDSREAEYKMNSRKQGA